ncbi:hypothetical protein C7T94_06020 [Pedobacter yulinensis]|uniref:Uncharacterized protein n=1 Tax=Pedobacter yulinensis TaxID=2126353 RepID=A0A2T3HP95_9SPHI|nr:hypothetical protein [Pedobacter yulinensis]PST84275.1 hypothetical protein C7T94_06020 [Pedobacter yulinensis]
MSILTELSVSIRNVLDTFFGSDTDVMSQQVKYIMANPQDRRNYLNALQKLRALEEQGQHGTEVVRLSNNESLELTV